MNMHGVSSKWSVLLLAAVLGIATLWIGRGVNAATTADTTDVPISLTVNAPAESVRFTGTASLRTRQILDPVFGNPPMVEIIVDLGHVSGVGTSTGRQYVVSGPVIVRRVLQATDLIEATFPYYPIGEMLSARTLVVSCNCGFNVATGAITSAPLRLAGR